MSSSLLIGLCIVLGVVYLWLVVRPLLSLMSKFGELGTPGGFVIIGLLCLPLAASVAVFAGSALWGNDQSKWPFGIRLGMLLFIAIALFLPAWHFQRADRRAQDQWIEESRTRSPKEIDEPAPRPLRQTMAWTFGGMLLFAIVAWFVGGDLRIPPSIRLPALLFLPFIGGGLGFYLSPGRRAETEFLGRVKDEHDRHDQQQVGTQEAAWTRRLKEAFFWWVSQGQRLYESDDLHFFRDYVRAQTAPVTGRRDQILAAFHNEADVCSTAAKRQVIAQWVLNTRPDLMTEHLTNESNPSTERIADILGLHFQRENHLLVEATALNTERIVESVRPPKEESLEETFRRIMQQYDADLRAAEVCEQFLNENAPPSQRDEYIKNGMRLVNDLLQERMKSRIHAAQKKAPTH